MNFMKYFALLSIIFGSYICLCNWYTLYDSWRKKRFISSVPGIGAIFLGFGLFYFDKTKPYAIFSIIIDYGTLIIFISIPKLIKYFWQTSIFNLEKRFTAKNNIAAYDLKLYKSKLFILQISFEPPQICNEHGAKIISSGYEGNWQEAENSILLTDYSDDRTLELLKSGSHYTSKESNYPDDKEYCYDQLNEITFALYPV